MTSAATTGRHRLPAAVPIAIGLAWAAAIAAHATGLSHSFHHDALVDGNRGIPAVTALAGFATVWTIMVAAMMLPSAVPLLRLFAAASAAQEQRGRVLAYFVGGYLAVWVLFGWVALAFDGGVHHAVNWVPWLAAHPWLVGAATLALAGGFQFSGLKDRCLTQCRHPAAYLLRHYRRGLRAAFHLGWGHGLSCLGCCWALMLVMFAAGVADLRWMAALGALMTYEKVGRYGRAAATAAGIVALILAVPVTLHPGWLPPILSSKT